MYGTSISQFYTPFILCRNICPLFFLHKGQFLQTGWQSPHIPPCKRAIFCEKCDQKLGYMFIPIKSASFLGDFHFCLKMIIPLCNLPHFWEIFTFLHNWSYPHVICLIFWRFLFFFIKYPISMQTASFLGDFCI